MTRFAWATDLHLNFIDRTQQSILLCGKYMAESCQADILLLTGDTSEGLKLRGHLQALQAGWGKPIWFVLGNHDYYGTDWQGARKDLEGLPEQFVFLDPAEPVLINGIAVVGQSGWFDSILDPKYEMALGETARLACCTFDPRDLIREKMVAQSRQEALQAYRKIEASYQQGARKVVLLTHAPPYKLASWFQGKHSDPGWLGIMTSYHMGRVIDRAVTENPDLEVVVLCGHTHSPGEYHRGPRIKVLTGPAQYSAPQEIPGFSAFDLRTLFEPGRVTDWPFAHGPVEEL